MPQDTTKRRRWVGAGALVASLAMLVAGETILKSSLKGAGYVVYWMICILLTGLAMLIALLDARALMQRTRQEHHHLLESTIEEIQEEAKNRSRKDKR